MRELTERDERRLAKLDALEAGGVDNWEWYDESLNEWREENGRIEQAEKFVEEIAEVITNDCRIDEPAGPGCGYGLFETEPLLKCILRNVEKFKEKNK